MYFAAFLQITVISLNFVLVSSTLSSSTPQTVFVKLGNTFHLQCLSNKSLGIRWTFQTNDNIPPQVIFNGELRGVYASIRHSVNVDKEHGSELIVSGMTYDDVGIYNCSVIVTELQSVPETRSFTVLLDGENSSEISYYMAAIGGLSALVVVVAVSCFCWKKGRCSCQSKSKPDTNKSVSRATSQQPVYSVVVDPEDRWLQKCAMKQNEQQQTKKASSSSAAAAVSAATATASASPAAATAAAPASKDVRVYYDDVREKKKTPRKYQKNVKPAAGPGKTAVPAAATAEPLEPVVYSVAHSSFATIPAKANKNTYSSYSEIALNN